MTAHHSGCGCAECQQYRSIRLRLPSDVTTITAEQLYEHYGNDFRGRVSSVFTEDTDSGLSDRLRANVSRFAAYKAEYVHGALQRALNDESTSADERTKLAKAVLNVFNRYQDAERSTATARARTAKQFEEFMQPDNVRLFPNLKWLPSRSADPRASHTVFYNRIWAKDDPFWNTNAPGTEWNCKCDIEETDEPATDNNAVPQTKVPLGLEGNPAKTGEIFTDNASYIRASSRSNSHKTKIESKCQSLDRKRLHSTAKTHPLLNQTTECIVDGVTHKVRFMDYSIREYAEKMYGTTNYWLKNAILEQMPDYIKKSVWYKSETPDLSHNTGCTLRLKKKFKQFHYLKATLPNGEPFVIELAEYKTGDFVLYTAVREHK